LAGAMMFFGGDEAGTDGHESGQKTYEWSEDLELRWFKTATEMNYSFDIKL